MEPGASASALRYARREAGVRTRMFMLALVLGSIARAAGAQRAEVAMPQLRYVAPASCPDRSFFVERMRSRLDAAQARALATLSLRVEVEPRAASVHGSVRIDRGVPSAPRTLEGASCREVVEGLALIAALAVTAPNEARRGSPSRSGVGRSGAGASPVAAQRPNSSTPPSAPSTAAPSTSQSEVPDRSAPVAGSTAQAPRAPREESAASARTAPASEAVAAETRDGEATANTRLPEPGRESAPADSPSEPIEFSRSGDPRVRGWAVSAGVLALHGLGPHIQPGLQLLAAVTVATGSVDWTLRLGGRLALRDTETSTQGSAHFGFASAVVQLCATGALGGDLTLDGCAVAEPGVLLTGADNTRNPQSYTRGWFAAGAGAGLGWRVAEWLSLRAGGEALVPTRRDRMLLAGEVLHRVPPACVRFGLSLEVPLG